VSFCRISDAPIRIHEPIARPDGLIVQDPTLLNQVMVFDGVGPDTYILINTSRSFAELGIEEIAENASGGRLMSVPGTEIAREHVGRPLPNAALLGGFAALAGAVSIESVMDAVRKNWAGPVGEANAKAAFAAYEYVLNERERFAHA
jgi:pyruvate ferredoxin oxidoreductase gamma subunit